MFALVDWESVVQQPKKIAKLVLFSTAWLRFSLPRHGGGGCGVRGGRDHDGACVGGDAVPD